MEQAFTYAVGDVHGEITLLQRLLALLPLRDEDTLIFLGDCLDLGKNSIATILKSTLSSCYNRNRFPVY